MSAAPDLGRDTVALGRQLRAARERANVSLQDAALALGEGHLGEDVGAIESGRLAPTLRQLYRLAAMYGASVDVCVWPRAASPDSHRR